MKFNEFQSNLILYNINTFVSQQVKLCYNSNETMVTLYF
jgi:hypothetical protein